MPRAAAAANSSTYRKRNTRSTTVPRPLALKVDPDEPESSSSPELSMEKPEEIVSSTTIKMEEDTNSADNHNRKQDCTTTVTSSSNKCNYECWKRALQREPLVWRVRAFKNNTRRMAHLGDDAGKAPALWCLEQGVILCSGRYLDRTAVTHPRAVQYISQKETNTFRDHVTGTKISAQHVGAARTFCTLNEGDIVALQIPGAKEEGAYAFGVVSSPELYFWYEKDLLERGFPCMALFDLKLESKNCYPFRCDGPNRLLVRKVKWYYKAFTYNLRSLEHQDTSKQCRWLMESPARWLNKMVHGLQYLSSPRFEEIIQPVDTF